MQEIISKVPSKYYCDMLYDSVSTTAIRKSVSGETITIPKSRGYVFRVFNGMKFIELADSDLDTLEARILKKIPQLEFFSNIPIYAQPEKKIDIEVPMQKNIGSISLDEKIQKIREIYEGLKTSDSKVINPVVSYQDLLLKRLFVNSEGSQLRRVIPRTRVFLQPIVKVDGQTDFDFQIFSGEIGFEIMDYINPLLISELVQSSIELAQAPLPPSGSFPVILDPSVAGLIAHESFGHGLEADQIVRGRSYLAPLFGKQVASSNVNISDSPVVEGAIGSYPFDDEGIIARKTPLIENGILTHYLHSRMTATILGEEPHGNGRRQGFMFPVYPRMSNTFFEPGNQNLEELFKDIKEGLFISKAFFGMEDPLGGGMQCTSRKGYKIENGEKKGLVKGITLSGKVLDLLMNIDGVSKGKITLDGGTCGKGIEDVVPVTSGGAYIRVKKAVVGPG